MKVIIISDYSDKHYGGLQTHVFHLTKNLSEIENVSIDVITLSDKNSTYNDGNLKIHNIKRFSKIPRLFTIISDSLKIKRKISELKPDIVHVQGTHYPYSYIAALISSNYPTVLTVHGLMAREYKFNKGKNYLGGIVNLFLEKYAFNKVKEIIICSVPMQKEVEKLSNANTYLVPNGIELNSILNHKPLKAVKHPSIMYMGLLEIIKGVDILIKAVAIIKKKIPNITLYIAGDGSQENYLKQLSKDLNLEENVLFLGYLGENSKYSYLKAVDICAITSRYESFGIVILEAMTCGKPVIGSNTGNIPFLVTKKTGILFESENEQDLALKIIKLIKNRDLCFKMSLNAQNEVKKFDWKMLASKTREIYEKLLNSKIQ